MGFKTATMIIHKTNTECALYSLIVLTIDTRFLFSLIFVLHSIKNPTSIEKAIDKLKETKI